MSAYVDDSMDIPIASNRIWYEVDINYESGYRNNSRIQPYRWIIQCYRFPLRAFGRGGFCKTKPRDSRVVQKRLTGERKSSKYVIIEKTCQSRLKNIFGGFIYE
ncbi:MAG: hypothetical protein IJW65_01680, partial [Clostridia bacterium]|nr:hypothetical protein [Clostridia bacterium]